MSVTLHKSLLFPLAFEMIKDGSVTIEAKLYNEMWQQIKIGDYIEYHCFRNSNRKIQTRVIALHRYTSFAELYNSLPQEKLGYELDETIDPYIMDETYSLEDQKKYGVVGIEMYCTDLQKFIDAQDNGYDFGETYQTALDEMKNGYKASHWIWYVFPQIQGLGRSGTTAYFSIKDLAEAEDYYAHPILKARLLEICKVLLNIKSDDSKNVFGYPDAFKVRSCMTLFKHAAPEQKIFQKVLDKFFCGEEDEKTLEILRRH